MGCLLPLHLYHGGHDVLLRSVPGATHDRPEPEQRNHLPGLEPAGSSLCLHSSCRCTSCQEDRSQECLPSGGANCLIWTSLGKLWVRHGGIIWWAQFAHWHWVWLDVHPGYCGCGRDLHNQEVSSSGAELVRGRCRADWTDT